MDSVKRSILIMVVILAITVLISFSICLLLRHLSRCRLSLSSVLSLRVSPDTPAVSFLDSLPVFSFSSVTRRRSPNSSSSSSGDCAVCLSKFEPNDHLRLLPLCCHAFHAECIDTWLVSNQTCPLCRSPIFASGSLSSSAIGASIGGNSGGDESLRIEIGSVSRRRAEPEDDEQQRSYSMGSFDYVVEGESEVWVSNSHGRSETAKEEATNGWSLADRVGGGSRNWLKDYVDRAASSFRSSGRLFFTGSTRRSELEVDLEANRTGEEISELFRWLSGI